MFPPQSGLTFEQAPPITVPFRFFLTAPLFLLLAAMLLAWLGPQSLVLRQAPATLALAHLLTVGVIAMVMCGALMQMLPVVAGSPMPYPRLVAAISHGLLTLGTPVLALAFLSGDKILSHIAMALLAGGFGTFILFAGISLARVKAYNATVVSMCLALAALAITVGLSVALLLARNGSSGIDYQMLAWMHPLWGLVGWIALLLIGVAYQVVPMFQITPNYPKPLTLTLTSSLFGLLVAKSLAAVGHAPAWLDATIDLGLAAGLMLFAVTTLRLQSQRKRRQTDPTLLYWRFGMRALIIAATGSLMLGFVATEVRETLCLLLGVVFIAGFVVGVISGMLYKIVPFLAWFHLQSRYARSVAIPNMKALIPDALAKGQMRAWFAACIALLLAVLAPDLFIYPAALLLALAALWLEWNLLHAVRGYRATQRLARPT